MIWLVGDKGMLGKELALLFEKNGVLFTGTDRETDITSAESLKDFAQKLLSAKKGTEPENHWIINCAAYTAVDKAEDDAKTCRLINETGAENLARCAEDTGARLIHLSTDYVFSGKGIPDAFGAPRPYREEDPADPICVYGRSKRNGETRVRERCGAAYIIRTAWLYGKYGNNFVETMLKLMGERGELNVVNDQRGSPTWAFDLAGIIAAIINAAEKGTDMPPGVYHFTNEGDITWFDFAREIYAQGRKLGLLSKECIIKPCASAEYPSRVKRPAYSVLDKSKIKAVLGIDIPQWNKSLECFLRLKTREVNKPIAAA